MLGRARVLVLISLATCGCSGESTDKGSSVGSGGSAGPSTDCGTAAPGACADFDDAESASIPLRFENNSDVTLYIGGGCQGSVPYAVYDAAGVALAAPSACPNASCQSFDSAGCINICLRRDTLLIQRGQALEMRWPALAPQSRRLPARCGPAASSCEKDYPCEQLVRVPDGQYRFEGFATSDLHCDDGTLPCSCTAVQGNVCEGAAPGATKHTAEAVVAVSEASAPIVLSFE